MAQTEGRWGHITESWDRGGAQTERWEEKLQLGSLILTGPGWGDGGTAPLLRDRLCLTFYPYCAKSNEIEWLMLK